jgi:hypothetical protein
MPNANRSLGVYVKPGNPDSVNDATLYRGGELGVAYDYNDRAYQVVQLDSGAVAANTVGVVAANQLAFWKDKDKYLVTNDKRQAIGGSLGTNAFANQVAGIFRCAATAGYYCHILQRGDYIPVSDDGSIDVGELVVADLTANTAKAAGTAVGTAAPYQCIGKGRVASSANVAYIDVDSPNIP